MTANEWIEFLRLQPHPEGGYFRETYRSTEWIRKQDLPERFSGDRRFSTAIYFLLAQDEFSALHRIQQDEIWHFYDGSSLTIHIIDTAGTYSTIRLGRRIDVGETPQAVVPAGSWFGASVMDQTGFSLVGCTVAPGFDFADFELPTREQLLSMFPSHRGIIERLTR